MADDATCSKLIPGWNADKLLQIRVLAEALNWTNKTQANIFLSQFVLAHNTEHSPPLRSWMRGEQPETHPILGLAQFK